MYLYTEVSSYVFRNIRVDNNYWSNTNLTQNNDDFFRRFNKKNNDNYIIIWYERNNNITLYT